MDSFLQILQNAGWIGTVVIILVLYRTGVLKELLSFKKNGNGEIKEIKSQLSNIENNHMHEMSESLKRIEDNLTRNFTILHERVGKIIENGVFIKAKLNGRE